MKTIIDALAAHMKLERELEDTLNEALQYGAGSVGQKALAPELDKLMKREAISKAELEMNGVYILR